MLLIACFSAGLWNIGVEGQYLLAAFFERYADLPFPERYARSMAYALKSAPVYLFDDERLVGWIATGPHSPKASDLAHEPRVSLTYWDPAQDVATAECDTVWEDDLEARRAGWRRRSPSRPAPRRMRPPPQGADRTVSGSGSLPRMSSFRPDRRPRPRPRGCARRNRCATRRRCARIC